MDDIPNTQSPEDSPPSYPLRRNKVPAKRISHSPTRWPNEDSRIDDGTDSDSSGTGSDSSISTGPAEERNEQCSTAPSLNPPEPSYPQDEYTETVAQYVRDHEAAIKSVGDLISIVRRNLKRKRDEAHIGFLDIARKRSSLDQSHRAMNAGKTLSSSKRKRNNDALEEHARELDARLMNRMQMQMRFEDLQQNTLKLLEYGELRSKELLELGNKILDESQIVRNS